MASRLTACLCLCESVTHTHVQNTYSNKRIKTKLNLFILFRICEFNKKNIEEKKNILSYLKPLTYFVTVVFKLNNAKRTNRNY